MNDASADKYVDAFFPHIESAHTTEQKKRTLRLMVKEVERDTRNMAVEIAREAVNTITRMEHS